MKHLLSLVLLGLALAGPALAAPPESAPVTALDSALIASMQAGSAGKDFTARYQLLAPAVGQSYNMPEVTQNSVGFLWATLPAAQQQQLIALFEQFTVSSYAAQFSAYGGEKLELQPDEKSLGAKKIVETKLIPGDGGGPTELDYVMENTPQGWRITDVLLNGTISQVAVHASDFAALVGSGDASRLIAALQTKIAALRSGTASQ